MKKYELTAETKINFLGRTLFRIKACVDFTTSSGDEVHAGDLGGYVEQEKNLSHDGKCWVCGDAKVWGNAEVCGDAKVCGDANIFSTKHIFTVTPVGVNADSMTVFRTKKREICIRFGFDLYTPEAFKRMVLGWEDRLAKVALAILDAAMKHIDLSEETPNLKPCPFCGSDKVSVHYDEDDDTYSVYCSECGASGALGDTEAAAIKVWNERAEQ